MRKPKFNLAILPTGSSRILLGTAVLAFSLMAASCHREACPGAITRTDQPQDQPADQSVNLPEEAAIESANQPEYPGAGSAQQDKSSLRVQG